MYPENWPHLFLQNSDILLSSVLTLVTNRCTISVLWGTLMSVTTNQLTSTQLYCYDKNVNLFENKKYFIDLKTHHTFNPQLSKVRTTKKNTYTVFPRIVSALEYFPPLNSFRTCMYCDERSQYIRLNSKKNSFRGNYSQKYGKWFLEMV